jgi:hypothetical protein
MLTLENYKRSSDRQSSAMAGLTWALVIVGGGQLLLEIVKYLSNR